MLTNLSVLLHKMVRVEGEELGTALGLNDSQRAKILFDINETYKKVFTSFINNIKEKVELATASTTKIEISGSVEDEIATIFATELYGMQVEAGGVFYAGCLYLKACDRTKASLESWFESYMQFKAKEISEKLLDTLTKELINIDI